MADPNLAISALSRTVHLDGVELEIEIVRLEKEPDWTLEVVADKGTSTVWDNAFAIDQDAFDETLKTIGEEGLVAFRHNANVSERR